MPQTSLLSFLTGSAEGTPNSLPIRKQCVSSFKPTQDPSRTVNHSPLKSESHQVSKTAPRSARLSQSSDHIHAGSLTTNLEHGIVTRATWPEEDEAQKLEEQNSSCCTKSKNTRTSTHHLTLPHCPSISIACIQPLHLPALKLLTSALLPMRYPDAFYDLAVSDPSSAALSRVALYDAPISSSSLPSTPSSMPIGWIRCSLEPCPSPQHASATHYQIYIKALCLLAPYRSLGVATALLDTILHQKDMLNTYSVKTIFAHVWERNDEALRWYEKRGFARDGALVDGYYRKLRPQGAWIVKREIG